jgi:O-antigen/teichoic acid export membrane protein
MGGVAQRARSSGTRFVLAIWHGPISRNLSGAMGTQLCLFVSGTITARLLGPQNRGYIAILTAWPSAIAQIGGVGMAVAATYFLSSRRIGGREVMTLLRRPAVVQITALTAVTMAIILSYTFISGAPILLPACMMFLTIPFGVFSDYGFAFLLGARQHGLVNLLRSLSPAVYAGALIILFIFDIRSLTIAVACLAGIGIVSATVVASYGVRAVRAMAPPRSIVTELGERAARRELLAFGRKGYVGYLSPVDTFRLDQLIIGFMLSPRVLGFYVVGASFSNFARLIAQNVGLSSTPEIASKATQVERWQAVRHTLILAGGLLTIINVALAGFVIVAIPIIFGEQYRSSIPVAEILLVAGMLLSMKRITVDSMRGAGEAQVGTHAEIVNVVLFLVTCAPLGLWLGGPGVALALVVATFGGSLQLVRRLHHFGVISRSASAIRNVAPAVSDR